MCRVPKVSIIMPVYNTESYIEQAINSIMQQTLHDIEIIVINDGSTDKSPIILKKLAEEDNRLQILSQKNQGQAAARNNGLKIASGEYIYFMDSDDLLIPNALECCYDKCKKENLDFVFFNAESFTDDNLEQIKYLDYYRTKKLINRTYKGIDILNIQLEKHEFKVPVWLNFIKRDYLNHHKITFNAATSPHEDQLFTFYLYINASRVGFLHPAFFRRRLRHNSVMTTKFAWRNMSKYLIIANELIEYKNGKSQEITKTIDMFLTQMMDAAIWNAHVLSLKERMHLFFMCKTKYSKYVQNKTLFILLAKKHLQKK